MPECCLGCLNHHNPSTGIEVTFGPCQCTCHTGGRKYGPTVTYHIEGNKLVVDSGLEGIDLSKPLDPTILMSDGDTASKWAKEHKIK